MNKQLVRDLSRHLRGQLIETVNRTLAIIDRPDDQLSVAVSACTSVLVALLSDAESEGISPKALKALRNQVAMSILHGHGHSAVIDAHGNKVPAES